MPLIPAMLLWPLQISDYNSWSLTDVTTTILVLLRALYSARSELTAITFAEALQTLLLLIDNIAVTLDAAGCICKGKIAKAKEVISNAISEWFSSITDYIKMYIQLLQTS